MTPIKSYTDIEQSKKLAQILPIESADMVYFGIHLAMDGKYYLSGTNTEDDVVPTYKNFCIKVFAKTTESDVINKLPCWSLAALLGVLPKEYTNSKDQVCTLHIDIVDSETPYLIWYANPEHEGSIVEIKTKEYSNLIDACYEMVLNLNKLNLL